MMAIMVSDSNLHATMAHSWMWSTQMRHTACVTIVKSALPREEADQGWTKLMADHTYLSKGR